jgi:hypothetical protein
VRIKKNIQPLDDEEALTIIRNIEPVKYEYKDPASRGYSQTSSPQVIGFIAQNIRAHLPHAVVVQSDFESTIMEEAVLTGITPTDLEVTFVNSEYTIPFNVGTSIGIKIVQTQYIVTCTSIQTQNSPHSFTFTWNEGNSPSSDVELIQGTVVLVTKQQLDDLHVLKKDVIFSVGIAALQQLDHEVVSLKTRVSQLESENSLLATTLQEISNKYVSLEARIQALE